MLLSVATVLVFLSSLVGLGSGQTAIINLTYPPTTLQQMTSTSPPSVCKVEVEFFDANSNLLNSQIALLTPGESAQVTLTRNQLGRRVSAHPLFWTEAVLINNCGNNPNCDFTLCNINATREEADSSNSTDLVIHNEVGLARFAAAPN
jgi:hypothetical protein